MLVFTPVEEEELGDIARRGLRSAPEGPVQLFERLDDAKENGQAVVVIDALRLDQDIQIKEGRASLGEIPREVIQNVNPYRPPEPIFAAGGYVMRYGSQGPEILLIFRRGVWDLPKGKMNPGESLEAGALREVREEVGIAALRLRRPLGTTVHGYPDGDIYRVKTTYWYLMETPERFFMPEAGENIEKVAWVPWEEAVEKIGYETLRRHMQDVAPVVVHRPEGARR